MGGFGPALGPHPYPPPEGHSSGSFLFPGPEEEEGSCKAGKRGWGRILEQQAGPGEMAAPSTWLQLS